MKTRDFGEKRLVEQKTIEHTNISACFQGQGKHAGTQSGTLRPETTSQPPAPTTPVPPEWAKALQNIDPNDHLAIRLIHLWPHLTHKQRNAVLIYATKLANKTYT